MQIRDRKQFAMAIYEIGRAGVIGGGRRGLTLKDVMPEDMQEAAKSFIKDAFLDFHTLRSTRPSLREIEDDISDWQRRSKTRVCRWHECKEVCTGNVYYCDSHRAMITEISMMEGLGGF